MMIPSFRKEIKTVKNNKWRRYIPKLEGFLFFSLIIFSLSFFEACTDYNANGTPEITYATEADFAADTSQGAIQLMEGFVLDLWAPGPLLANAVALSFDNKGVAYVSTTTRRKSSDIDIRAHRDWMLDDLSLQTIEDTRDFHLKKLDPSLSAQNTWQEDFNQDSIHDWRDLTVQSEYIRRIWDSDGDGRADASHIYAEGFNNMLTGVAAGILYHQDEVFLTAAPDVYRLADKDGDGDADEREIISHGYGIHIAYAGHDMSGLTIGPDGRIYWSIGDIGVNTVDVNGKRWAYPNQGAVMRCNPDGSDFEVFAHGLRNPQELAFDTYGNLISVDNDGDHPGEHERIVHIIEGSDTGWRINWQFGKYNQPNESYKIWMDEQLYIPHFPGQAAYLLPPVALAPDGPAGLAFNPGTALGTEWNNYFFGSYFKGSAAKSMLHAFTLKPKGASFAVDKQQEVIKGIASTGINFGPDGALYINDWKDGYALKPQGRIWKLDVRDGDVQEQRKATQKLLEEGMSGKSKGDLSALIAHADMRIRMAVQFELVKRKAEDQLVEIANNNTDELARIHAIWGLGQLARAQTIEGAVFLDFLDDENIEVSAQAIKMLGECKYTAAFDRVVEKLKSPSARLQFFAAEALGKFNNPAAFQPLVTALENVGDTDPHLRHAIMYGLSKINQEKEIAGLASHPSKDVRIGAVVALRHMQSAQVAAFLSDAHPWVLREAARAINDDLSIPDALPALAGALNEVKTNDEAFIRRAINANLRVGNAASATRLANYANNDTAPLAMRTDALWALGYWAENIELDRVDGRFRMFSDRNLADGQTAFSKVSTPLLAATSDTLLAASITALGRLKYTQEEATALNVFKRKNTVLMVRRAALNALANLESPNLLHALRLALADRAQGLREEAQTILGTAKLPQKDVAEMLGLALESGSVPEQQKALKSLASSGAKEAESVLNNWMDRLAQGKVAPELQLDVLQAVESAGFESGKNKITAYQAAKKDDPFALYEESIYGGNARKGGRLFFMNNTAQCARCHAYSGMGGAVGPALDGIASVLSPEDLLRSLVDPSARLAPGYGTVVLKLKSGEELTGILMAESNTNLQLKVGNNPVKRIAKTDIASRENLPSGMISMANMLSKNEIRDVMAFLLTMKEGVELNL